MKHATGIRRLWSSARGQSLVEFAMVLPLLLVVAFVVTEFGRALWIKNLMTEAAGNAARAAVVANVYNYQTKAEEAANRMLAPLGMSTTAQPPTTFAAEILEQAGTQVVHVTLSRPFSFIPSGGSTGLPTSPGAGGPFIPLVTFTITAEMTADTQPSFDAGAAE